MSITTFNNPGEIGTPRFSLKMALDRSKSQTKSDVNRALFLHQTGECIVQIIEVFALSTELEEGPKVYTRQNMFGVVNKNGNVTLWTFCPMPKTKICMTIVSGVSNVTGGSILLNDETNSQSLLTLQSNEHGIQTFKFNSAPFVDLELAPENIVSFANDKHIGFCTITSTRKVFAYPMHQYSFGLLSFQTLAKNILFEGIKEVHPQLKCVGSSLIMFIKLISYECNEYVLTGVEKGQLNIYVLKGSISEANAEFQLWESSIFLKECSFGKKIVPTQKLFAPEEDFNFLAPLCAEFRKETRTVIIGTNTKLIFIFKLDFDKEEIIFDGRRSLIQKGVNDMSLHPDGKLLALGGWDGVIRILLFPFLKQLTFIKFHESAINSLVFLRNYDGADSRKHYLLVGADDGQISCWNIDEKLSLNQGEGDSNLPDNEICPDPDCNRLPIAKMDGLKLNDEQGEVEEDESVCTVINFCGVRKTTSSM